MPKHEKEYWYWRRKGAFLDRPEIKLLQSKGDQHLVNYERFIDLALNTDGKLIANGISLAEDELAILTGRSENQILESLELMQKLGLIKKSEGCYVVCDFEQYRPSKSTEEADQKQEQRENQKRRLSSIETTNVVDSNSNNQSNSNSNYKNNHTVLSEIEYGFPSLEDVITECKENGYNRVNPDKFYYYYSNNGWKTKEGETITDWKNLVKKWNYSEKPSKPSFIATEEMQYEDVDLEEVKRKVFLEGKE